MKTISLIAALIFSANILCAQNGYVYANVKGSQVTVSQDNAEHNCGFRPGLDNVTINDGLIKWYQVDTAGLYVRCICMFDYSVTIGPLNPGDYKVQVYSVYTVFGETRTNYEGSTYFTIQGSLKSSPAFEISSYSSPCKKQEMTGEEQYSIERTSYGISITCKGSASLNRIEIANMSGQRVLSKTYNSETAVSLPLSRLSKGIYIISLYDDQNTRVTRKVVVF